MLINKSQLHPVMNSAAAGGKRIATCPIATFSVHCRQFGIATMILTTMRRTSDALTITIDRCELAESLRALGVDDECALHGRRSRNLIPGRLAYDGISSLGTVVWVHKE